MSPGGDNSIKFTLSGQMDAEFSNLLLSLQRTLSNLQDQARNINIGGTGGVGGGAGSGGGGMGPGGGGAPGMVNASVRATPSSRAGTGKGQTVAGGPPDYLFPTRRSNTYVSQYSAAPSGRGEGLGFADPRGPIGTVSAVDPLDSQVENLMGMVSAQARRSRTNAARLAQGAPDALNPFSGNILASDADFGGIIPAWMIGYGGRFLKGGLAVGGRTAGDYAALQTQAILSGHTDPMGAAQMIGGGLGGLAGAAIGSLFPGFGTFIGGAVGMTAGAQVAGYAFAPFQDRISAQQATIGVSASVLRSGTTMERFSFAGRTLRMGDISDYLNARLPDTIGVNERIVGQAWANTAQGMIAGGVSPFGLAGTATMYGGKRSDAIDSILDDFAKDPYHASKLGISEGVPALLKLKALGMGPEQNAEAVVRRVFQRYGDPAGQDVLKNILPVYASLPESGGNIVDILGKFGSLATQQYRLSTVNDDRMVGGLDELMVVDRGIRSSRRKAVLGGLQATGKGQAVESALVSELAFMHGLDKKDASLAFAETLSGRRAATMQKYAEQDILGYGIPMAHLAGEEARQAYLPFSPGNSFATQLRMIGLNTAHLSTLTHRYSTAMGRGDLSEEQQLTMVGQMEGLQTAIARSYGILSEGMENRLPAMAAGRPSFGGRFTSNDLAAINLNMMGSPIRAYGAQNGRQASAQNAFASSFAVPTGVGPTSQSEGLNNLVPLFQRMVSSLDRIAASSSGRIMTRSGESWGASVGTATLKDGGTLSRPGAN